MTPNATHDWSNSVDERHLQLIRNDPARFAPGGVTHLVLEVLAYAAEEAEDRGSGSAVVTLHSDGSISIADDGRGTETQVGAEGAAVRKPVMSTKDLRYFDESSEVLPDGHLRRGISVVAALSDWLVHSNRRENGSWTQRYEHGIPVSELTPIPSDGTTGTTVHFMPGHGLAPVNGDLLTTFGEHFTVSVRRES